MSNAKPARYFLEIYSPHDYEKPDVSMTASSPFQAITAGDFFDCRAWEGFWVKQWVRVKRVEHIIWENDTHVNHKLMVITEDGDPGYGK